MPPTKHEKTEFYHRVVESLGNKRTNDLTTEWALNFFREWEKMQEDFKKYDWQKAQGRTYGKTKRRTNQ